MADLKVLAWDGDTRFIVADGGTAKGRDTARLVSGDFVGPSLTTDSIMAQTDDLWEPFNGDPEPVFALVRAREQAEAVT